MLISRTERNSLLKNTQKYPHFWPSCNHTLMVNNFPSPSKSEIQAAIRTSRTPLRQVWTNRWKSAISEEPLMNFKKWDTALKMPRKSSKGNKKNSYKLSGLKLTSLSLSMNRKLLKTTRLVSNYLARFASSLEKWTLSEQASPISQILSSWVSAATIADITQPRPRTAGKSVNRHSWSPSTLKNLRISSVISSKARLALFPSPNSNCSWIMELWEEYTPQLKGFWKRYNFSSSEETPSSIATQNSTQGYPR